MNLIFPLLFLLIPIFILFIIERPILSTLGFVKVNFKKDLFNSLFIFVQVFFISLMITIFFSFFSNVFPSNFSLEFSIQAILFLLFVAISEEVFFRGFLVKFTGVYVSSALFGILHFFNMGLLGLSVAFISGLIFANYFEKEKSIYTIILAHFLYNLSALFMSVWFLA